MRTELRILTLVVGLTHLGCGETSEAKAATGDLTSVTPQASPSCGRAGMPDCPLQSWMKSTLQTYQRAANYERLERAFGELAKHAPAGYDDWQAQAERGAALAAKHDETALKQACKDCHDAHRARYRRERRAEPLW